MHYEYTLVFPHDVDRGHQKVKLAEPVNPYRQHTYLSINGELLYVESRTHNPGEDYLYVLKEEGIVVGGIVDDSQV